MTNGKLIGIGVGPGDSELLTVKGAKIIENIPVICAPRSQPNKESIALSIIQPYIDKREDKKIMIIEPIFPMTENKEKLESSWNQAAAIISNYLESGRDVAFITLGDPSIYSTFSYVQKRLEDKFEIEMVPGINSFTACAASIKKPLVEKDEILTIIPKIDSRLKDLLEIGDSFVLMKTSRNTEELDNIIHKTPREKEIISIENCSRENEKIIKGFSSKKPYLTTTIVKLEK